MRRKQDYKTCPWCIKLGEEKPVRRARHQALHEHMQKCKARYQIVIGKIPSRTELLEMQFVFDDRLQALNARVRYLEDLLGRVARETLKTKLTDT